MIRALVRAQEIMHKGGMRAWCSVYRAVAEVEAAGNHTLRPAAMRAIMTYMRGYRSYCR
jgi:hypothetical protein